MASAFGHAFLAYGLSKAFPKKFMSKSVVITGMVSSAIPDLDVLAFKFGIPYEHMFGHRGISHSICFALIWSIGLCSVLSRKRGSQFIIFLYLFLCTVSHGILDAMTTGGRGIAFFAPFSETRHFLPYRMIQVSPLHFDDFWGEWGKQVIISELYWIGIPVVAFILLTSVLKKV